MAVKLTGLTASIHRKFKRHCQVLIIAHSNFYIQVVLRDSHKLTTLTKLGYIPITLPINYYTLFSHYHEPLSTLIHNCNKYSQLVAID